MTRAPGQQGFSFGAPRRFVRERPSLAEVEFSRAEFAPRTRLADDACRLCLFDGNTVPDPDCDWCRGTGIFSP